MGEKYNIVTFGEITGVYKDIASSDTDTSFNMTIGGNYRCYEKLGKYYCKKNPKVFNKNLIGSCDFYLPTQVFNGMDKNIVYLNHRFPHLGYFNFCKFSDWKKKINNLKQNNNKLIVASNFDYEYYKYFLGDSKKIYHIPPLLDDIQDKYSGSDDSYLIVPGKSKSYKSREKIIDICINKLGKKGIDNVFSVTRKYKNKTYDFKEIAQYKALIVIPYTIYIGSIMDFLDMGMPMFFPSVKLISQWHKELNILAEYDLFSRLIEQYGKNFINKNFINKIENFVCHNKNVPSPYSEDINALEYRISKSDWYTNWPIITFDSFDDLADKLKTTNMVEYSKTLLSFNDEQKNKSKNAWKLFLNTI